MKTNNLYTQQSTYDYSQLIATAKEESQYKGFSDFIDEKIHDLRDRDYDGVASRFNRSTLAEIIGIDTSTLTKIINRRQGTRKRDLIIALCFALQLTCAEADLALNLYPMAPLNSNNLRDLVISQALRNGASVTELNTILLEHRLPQLNITRGQKDEERGFYFPLNETNYDEISVSILPYCVAGDDSDRSLHDRYRPDRFSYQSEMIIREKTEKGNIYHISLDGSHYTISWQNDGKRKPCFSDDRIDQKHYNIKECNDAGLLNEVAKLKEYTDRRARYVHGMCDDTRNYGSRFDAINNNGSLVIYGESFDFDNPEFCEYFQLEASSTGCIFTVSNSSRFLKRYLGEEEWMRFYRNTLSPVTQSFSTLEEVPNKQWRKIFQSLLDSARDLLNQLRERKVFLFNAYAWLDFDMLMDFFHTKDAFECYQPDDSPTMLPGKDHIIGPDGNPITVDDLFRAAELDIFTIEELCSIRTHYGTLEDFINIDALTEQKGNNNE